MIGKYRLQISLFALPNNTKQRDAISISNSMHQLELRCVLFTYLQASKDQEMNAILGWLYFSTLLCYFNCS